MLDLLDSYPPLLMFTIRVLGLLVFPTPFLSFQSFWTLKFFLSVPFLLLHLQRGFFVITSSESSFHILDKKTFLSAKVMVSIFTSVRMDSQSSARCYHGQAHLVYSSERMID